MAKYTFISSSVYFPPKLITCALLLPISVYSYLPKSVQCYLPITAILNSSISNLKAVKRSGTESENDDNSIKIDQKFKLYQLTNREIEISKFIIKGTPYKEIAKTLFIAEKTVSKHIQNIFEKVGVSNKVEFINKLNS